MNFLCQKLPPNTFAYNYLDPLLMLVYKTENDKKIQ